MFQIEGCSKLGWCCTACRKAPLLMSRVCIHLCKSPAYFCDTLIMLKALVVSDLLNTGATLAKICTWLVQNIQGPESNAL